jgi:predicted dehydrogenase
MFQLNQFADKPKIKWGVLGTSAISRTVSKAIQESPDAILSAIGSRQISNAQAFAEQFKIPKSYDNYDDLLSDPETSAVYIGLPNHLHKTWIIKCLNAGKHVLCEKPLVLDEQEYSEISQLAVVKSLICLEGLMYRHHPFIKKLRKILVEDKCIGEILSFDASYFADIAKFANPTAGGAIRNLGCYPISLVRLLTNSEPIAINAIGMMNSDNTAENTATIDLKFPNNCVAHITTADNANKFFKFEVTGTTGKLICQTNPWMPKPSTDSRLTIMRYGSVSPEEISISDDTNLYSYQINLINEHIHNNAVKELNRESLAHSRGNVIVISKSLEQVKQVQVMPTEEVEEEGPAAAYSSKGFVHKTP